MANTTGPKTFTSPGVVGERERHCLADDDGQCRGRRQCRPGGDGADDQSRPRPSWRPGTTFSVTDTVQNAGTGEAGASTTRYYLSLDAVKSPGDMLLTGTHSVPGLAPGASHTGTVTVTIPATTSPNSYFLLACADDLNAVTESNEGNNCIASAGAIVTVARPDLAETAVTAYSARARQRARDDVLRERHRPECRGRPSGPSTTRYYLSLDAVKNAGDILLTGSRGRARAGGRGPVRGTRHGDHPLDHAAQHLLPAGLRRRRQRRGGEPTRTTTARRLAGRTVTVTRPDLSATAVTMTPARARPRAGDHVLGHGHDPELRGGRRVVDDALLPLAGRR